MPQNKAPLARYEDTSSSAAPVSPTAADSCTLSEDPTESRALGTRDGGGTHPDFFSGQPKSGALIFAYLFGWREGVGSCKRQGSI